MDTDRIKLAQTIGQLGIGDVIDRLAAHEPDTEPSERASRHASVAMILRAGESTGLESLFIKRAEHPLDPWSGHMAFPGGRRDGDHETLEEVARRETLEEVGIDLSEEMLIGRLHDIGGGRLKTHEMSVSPFIYQYSEKTELSLNYEVADAVWVPLEFMAHPENVTDYYYPNDPRNRPFPSFKVQNDYTIWGMTFRMVGSFFDLFGVELPTEGGMTDVE